MASLFRDGDDERLVRRLVRVTGGQLGRADAERLVQGDMDALKGVPRKLRRQVRPLFVDEPSVQSKLEAIVGPSLDLVPVAYLDRARAASRSVARIVTQERKARGTGFLISPTLLLTNHHVIKSAAEAEDRVAQFDWELDVNNVPLSPTEFSLHPDVLFWTSPVDELDATLIAVGDRLSGLRNLDEFGYQVLSNAEDKHAEGDFVTIVQHPEGDYKQVALRDNRVIGRGQRGRTLHYEGDTLKGSSGSPVFNDQFDLVALHHAAGGELEHNLDDGRDVPSQSNEGIRISSVVAALQDATTAMPKDALLLLTTALNLEPPK